MVTITISTGSILLGVVIAHAIMIITKMLGDGETNDENRGD